MLSDAGLRVVVVDRRGALRGSTAASTSLIQYELDKPLTKLAEIAGREKAERMWRRSRLAVDALRERSRQLGIQADQVNRDSLYLSGNVLDRAGLLREADARRRAGFNTTFLEQREVREQFGVKGRSALLSYDNFAADPRRLAGGFLRAAIARGTRVYAPVEVTRGPRNAPGGRGGHEGRPGDSLPGPGLCHRLRDAEGGAHEEPPDLLDLGDCHASPAARAVAHAVFHLGGCRSVPVYARVSGQSGHLRRGGRGVQRRSSA